MLPRKRQNALIRAFLVAHYPNCFYPPKFPKKPLKIGIFDDIHRLHPEIELSSLHNALSDYAGGPSYKAALIEGNARVDLDGCTAGYVTGEAEALARKYIGQFSEATRALWTRHILSDQQAAE